MVALLSEERLLELLAGVAVLLREGVAHPLDQLPHQVVLQGHSLSAVAVQVRLDQACQVSKGAIILIYIYFESKLAIKLVWATKRKSRNLTYLPTDVASQNIHLNGDFSS